MSNAIPFCKRCKDAKNVRLRRQINTNGATVFIWYCQLCRKNADSKFIKKGTVQRWIDSGRLKNAAGFDDIPIADDYSQGMQCAVCGAPGAENHHWLPQCFNEQVPNFLNWPTDYLCTSCHDLWHEFVTPYLPGRGATREARYTIEKYIRSNGK